MCELAFHDCQLLAGVLWLTYPEQGLVKLRALLCVSRLFCTSVDASDGVGALPGCTTRLTSLLTIFCKQLGFLGPPAGNLHDGGHVNGFGCILLHGCSCKLIVPRCQMLLQSLSTLCQIHTLEDVLQHGLVEAVRVAVAG